MLTKKEIILGIKEICCSVVHYRLKAQDLAHLKRDFLLEIITNFLGNKQLTHRTIFIDQSQSPKCSLNLLNHSPYSFYFGTNPGRHYSMEVSDKILTNKLT